MAYLIALLGAWFGFANPVLHIPVAVVLFPCALVWLGTTAESSGKAFKRGWLAGLLAYTACLYWVVLPVHVYGPLPWVLALPCPILIGVVLGLFPAVFALLLHIADHRLPWWAGGLFAGSVWASLELARSIVLTGFPWLSLPQAFGPWPQALQGLEVMGTFCFSGILVAISTWLVHGVHRAVPLIAALLLAGGIIAYGSLEMQRPQQTESTFSASIIQGNIDQNRKWDPAFQQTTLDTYLAMTRREIERHDPDLILWPETALPFYVQEEDSPLKDRLQAFIRRHNRPLLTGAPGYARLSRGSSDADQLTMFNRAYLFNDQGRIADSYEKEHLVPFGEYVPLKGLLPFLDSLVPGEIDFSPGRRTMPLDQENLAMGALICYEVIFPGLVQERVRDGAKVLINLSNDAWFGRSSAPVQHLHQAILRAIEQRRYLVRTTNTGISAVIDPRGRVAGRTPLFKEATLYHQDVGLISSRSLYSRFHAVFTALPPAVAGLLFVLALIRPAGTSKGRERPRFR